MRAPFLVSATALLGLWVYFLADVAGGGAGALQPLPAGKSAGIAATLNEEARSLDASGRSADALAALERASEFRSDDAVLAANLKRERGLVREQGWLRVLDWGSAAFGLLAFLGLLRKAGDRRRLARIRLLDEPWLTVPPKAETLEVPLRFNRPVRRCLLRRHPLTVVWSSQAYGKHMKSRPPVRTRGAEITVELDRARLDRLRRYPGSWRAFFYLGSRPVGRADAAIGVV